LAGLLPERLHALSGPPLVALALAGGVLLASESKRRPGPWVFLSLVVVVYLGVAFRVQGQVGPEGDEPHYLMVADSLLRDHDLALERDYEEGRYRAFHPAPLAPHFRVRGRGGQIYSLHALGLSLLVLPAYGLGGYPGASFFMALVAALLAWEVRGLLRETWGHEGAAEAAAWVVAFSPPLVHYAGLIFTEVPAALIVAVALRRGRAPLSSRTLLLLGAALGCLPWLNVRYAPLALILLIYVWFRSGATGRGACALAVPAALSAVALVLYHYNLYGFFNPSRVYGARPELSLAGSPEGLQGLFLDQEFGLLAYAPAFVLVVPGLVALYRWKRQMAVAAIALVAVVVLTAASWPMWRGGFNPPARFLVPLLPVFALGLAGHLRRGLSAGAALLIGWGLWTGLTGAWDPRLVHRDRDGTAPLFREASGAEEWTRLLPGYVLDESAPDRNRLALVWSLALLAAAASRRRGVLSGAVAVVVLAGSVAAASWMSTARTGGRDAVRLIGRGTIDWPGWRWSRVAGASWTPLALDWGPLYEPHRHPDGALLGARLPLPAGPYRLELQVDDLAPEAPPPDLVQETEPQSGTVPISLSREGGVLAGRLDVGEGTRATSLRLRGGGALSLREINLLRAGESNPETGGGLQGHDGASHSVDCTWAVEAAARLER
jgi:hypothetical protein